MEPNTDREQPDDEAAAFLKAFDEEAERAFGFRDAPRYQQYVDANTGWPAIDMGDGSTVLFRPSDGAMIRRWPSGRQRIRYRDGRVEDTDAVA